MSRTLDNFRAGLSAEAYVSALNKLLAKHERTPPPDEVPRARLKP